MSSLEERRLVLLSAPRGDECMLSNSYQRHRLRCSTRLAQGLFIESCPDCFLYSARSTASASSLFSVADAFHLEPGPHLRGHLRSEANPSGVTLPSAVTATSQETEKSSPHVVSFLEVAATCWTTTSGMGAPVSGHGRTLRNS